MIKYVWHNGSGTYIPVDECTVIAVTEEVDEAINRGDVTAGDCDVIAEDNLEDVLACVGQLGWPDDRPPQE